MPNNSRADVVRYLAERYGTKSNEKLGGFRSQLEASYVSSHTEELWYKETVYLWMTNIYFNFTVCIFLLERGALSIYLWTIFSVDRKMFLGVCLFDSTNAFGKVMNQCFLPHTLSLWVNSRADWFFFILGLATSLKEIKLWIQNSFTLLENWPCFTSFS